VRSRRGAKLADDPDLFTGRFWSGTAAVRLGLVDSLGDLTTVLRERYGAKVSIRPVSAARAPLWRRLGVGLSGEELIGAVRADSLWARYGL
jgi:ClpP class serine protease